jgi:hypothetical protein
MLTYVSSVADPDPPARIRIIMGSWILILIRIRIKEKSTILGWDPHQRQKVNVLEGHFGALERQNLDPNRIER